MCAYECVCVFATNKCILLNNNTNNKCSYQMSAIVCACVFECVDMYVASLIRFGHKGNKEDDTSNA